MPLKVTLMPVFNTADATIPNMVEVQTSEVDAKLAPASIGQ
jgi:hypothetical protein